MVKVQFGVKDRSEQKTREATENLKRQKSLGVYHDFACQTIASTKEKCLAKTRQDPQKTKKKQEKKNASSKKCLIVEMETLIKKSPVKWKTQKTAPQL